jgi:hypothetical protein
VTFCTELCVKKISAPLKLKVPIIIIAIISSQKINALMYSDDFIALAGKARHSVHYTVKR